MLFTLIGQALIGWLVADLLGGHIHWWEDRVGRPTNAWIDKHVLGPNDRHHVAPMEFTETGFWYRNSTTIAAAAIAALVWFLLLGPSVVWFVAFVGGCVQNEVHYYTHKRGPEIVRVFQRVGIIQSVPEHAGHHKPPQNKNYCILTGWLNPILEHIGYWRFLERIFKIAPRDTTA